MVQLWRTYCLSLLEQSCVVWDSGLTRENELDLERCQKTLCKLILEENYISYLNALSVLRLQTLKQRRKTLTLRFVERSLADGNLHDLFHKRRKTHDMQTRRTEKYNVFHANTVRYQNSPILTMQREMNKPKKK